MISFMKEYSLDDQNDRRYEADLPTFYERTPEDCPPFVNKSRRSFYSQTTATLSKSAKSQTYCAMIVMVYTILY